jgi:hypothetical protein
VLAKLLNKPPTYTGSPNADLRLWLTMMCHYLTAQALQYPHAVALAVTFLVGEAAKFWHSHSKVIQQQGQDIHDWHVFKHALYMRFGYHNAENAARDQLHDLAQGDRSFAQYVNVFDDCYANIPEHVEAEKIHRFLRGLRRNIQFRLAINPTTGKRWTSYYAMVAFGHQLLNESALPGTDLSHEVTAQLATKKRTTTRASDEQQPGSNNGKRHRGDSTRRPHAAVSAETRDSEAPARLSEDRQTKLFTLITPSGSRNTFSRPVKVANFCMVRHICAHCYKKGHSPNHCHSAKVEGNPPGFDPNYKPKRK